MLYFIQITELHFINWCHVTSLSLLVSHTWHLQSLLEIEASGFWDTPLWPHLYCPVTPTITFLSLVTALHVPETGKDNTIAVPSETPVSPGVVAGPQLLLLLHSCPVHSSPCPWDCGRQHGSRTFWDPCAPGRDRSRCAEEDAADG